MCILFCYLADEKVDIGYELILLSNRDEDFQRPAIQAHIWKNTKYAIGGSHGVRLDKKGFLLCKGQDQTALREGGTWLCLNTVQGRIGILLNLTSRLFAEKNINAQSRGFLVPNYVNNSEVTLDSYVEELQKTKMNYTGFNFLGLERQTESKKWRAKYLNNISLESLPVEIDTQIFGFSNHLYGDEYAFEKTRRGCQLLKTFVSDLTDNHTKRITDEKELIQRTLSLLDDNTDFPEDLNIGTVYSHYTVKNRHQISSIHVRTTPEAPSYGTRTSTVILIRRDQTGLFIEKTLRNPMENPFEWSVNTWQFTLNDVNEPPVLINE